ncbi:MAG: cupin domain-containing protein [Candidatus Latescibacteria bacterium]|nr:cupin domain-containing protein [Candidatus Latescibacterota bacterium]
MRIAHARREEMQEIDKAHGGAGPVLFKSLFERKDFQTEWWFVHSAYLLPGGGIGHHRHDRCEEIFVTIDNASQFTHNGRTTQVEGGAAVPLRCGESHAIYNHTQKETRWFNFNVTLPGCPSDATDFGDTRVGAPLESTDRLPIGRFDRKLLEYTRLHQGKGEVGRRQIWGPQDFRTSLAFLSHILVPPGASVGYHSHQGMEECYVIMKGSARMTVDGETAEVFSGDAIPNRLGGSHGLYNHTQDELEFFLVAVCKEKGVMDTTDLGDDLTKR